MSSSDWLGVIGILISFIGLVVSVKIYKNQLLVEERRLAYKICIVDYDDINSIQVKEYLDDLRYIIEVQIKLIKYCKFFEYIFVLNKLNLYIKQELGECIILNNFTVIKNEQDLIRLDSDTKRMLKLCRNLVFENHSVITNEVMFSTLRYRKTSFVINILSYVGIAQDLKKLESSDTIDKLDKYCFSYLFKQDTNTLTK